MPLKVAPMCTLAHTIGNSAYAEKKWWLFFNFGVSDGLFIYSFHMNVTQNGRWFIKIHSYLGYDATKITENFSVAFSWRLSQGFIFQCGGFRAFWRNLVLICLEIQHGIAAASTWNLKISSRQNCFFNFNGKIFPFWLFLLLTRNLVWICNIMKTLRKSRIKVKSPLEVTDLESGKLIHFIFY